MTIQFLHCSNPNKSEQGEYIYHDGFPCFIAKVEGEELVLYKKFDSEEEDYTGKLSAAKKWLRSFKNKR